MFKNAKSQSQLVLCARNTHPCSHWIVWCFQVKPGENNFEKKQDFFFQSTQPQHFWMFQIPASLKLYARQGIRLTVGVPFYFPPSTHKLGWFLRMQSFCVPPRRCDIKCRKPIRGGSSVGVKFETLKGCMRGNVSEKKMELAEYILQLLLAEHYRNGLI